MGLLNGYGTKRCLAEGECFPTKSPLERCDDECGRYAPHALPRPARGRQDHALATDARMVRVTVGRSGDQLVGKVEPTSECTTRWASLVWTPRIEIGNPPIELRSSAAPDDPRSTGLAVLDKAA
jgi:hypothetical protein